MVWDGAEGRSLEILYVCLCGYLGGSMWGSSLIQQQQCHSLIIVVSSYMQWS